MTSKPLAFSTRLPFTGELEAYMLFDPVTLTWKWKRYSEEVPAYQK